MRTMCVQHRALEFHHLLLMLEKTNIWRIFISLE